ncbi:MAG: protein translocase SEC61 complex subunit gamma [Candidatus Woesearchaeota archaeon]
MELRKFWNQCKRVLKVTKKPNKKEYSMVAKVTGFGILVLGLVGFIVFLIIRIISGQ